MEKNNERNRNTFEELVDIRDVKIDRTLPSDERIRSFIEQIKNPYCFKVGDTVEGIFCRYPKYHHRQFYQYDSHDVISFLA